MLEQSKVLEKSENSSAENEAIRKDQDAKEAIRNEAIRKDIDGCTESENTFTCIIGTSDQNKKLSNNHSSPAYFIVVITYGFRFYSRSPIIRMDENKQYQPNPKQPIPNKSEINSDWMWNIFDFYVQNKAHWKGTVHFKIRLNHGKGQKIIHYLGLTLHNAPTKDPTDDPRQRQIEYECELPNIGRGEVYHIDIERLQYGEKKITITNKDLEHVLEKSDVLEKSENSSEGNAAIRKDAEEAIRNDAIRKDTNGCTNFGNTYTCIIGTSDQNKKISGSPFITVNSNRFEYYSRDPKQSIPEWTLISADWMEHMFKFYVHNQADWTGRVTFLIHAGSYHDSSKPGEKTIRPLYISLINKQTDDHERDSIEYWYKDPQHGKQHAESKQVNKIDIKQTGEGDTKITNIEVIFSEEENEYITGGHLFIEVRTDSFEYIGAVW